MAIDTDSYPTLAPGVERRDFGSYGIAAPPGGGSMLHLEPDEFAILALLDGTRTPGELERVAGVGVGELLDDLRDEGFLVDSPPTRPEGRVGVSLHGIEFGGFDRLVRGVNRVVGDVVFSAGGVAMVVITAAVGFVVFVAQVQAGYQLTVSLATPVLAVFVLRMLGFVAVWLHESGHALVIVRNNRRVGRAGVGFYWGSLTFYVDASQALFFGRRTRMLQSSAGLITDVFLCGAASLVAATGGDASWAVLLREFAVLGYLGVLLNAVPLLELDGYWFLADALDRPTLQRDSRRALTSTLQGHPDNLGLAGYAALSIGFGLVGIAVGVLVWWTLFGSLFHELWAGGPGYKALAAYLLLPYLVMIAHLASQPLRSIHRKAASQISAREA